jgi:hypothetical protein
MQDDVLNLALEVSRVAGEKISVINTVMRRTQMLSLNARLEASRAGEFGAPFAVVAQEMSTIASEVSRLSTELHQEIEANTVRIGSAGRQMLLDFRGQRFADLALNAVEIIDRNLYERSCDVRWWATDSAVVDALEEPSASALKHAAERLATILRSYTVYLDLWVADSNGNVIVNGRGDRYPKAIGQSVAHTEWFRRAMETQNGDEFAVCDITRNMTLDNCQVATYSTAIRLGGATYGQPIGALGIFFDWEPQAKAIVRGVALSDEERRNSRVMLLNARHEIIAASDGRGLLEEQYKLNTDAQRGYYVTGDNLVSFSVTPGYETYRGLGWYGCIESKITG